MPLSRSSIARLAKTHPHSAGLIKVFAPFIRIQKKLAESPEQVTLPALDPASFAAGKPWFQAKELPYSGTLLRKAVTQFANAAAKALSAQAEAFAGLKAYLRANPSAAGELVGLRLEGHISKTKAWAKKHGQPQDAAALLATLLGGAMARHARIAAQGQTLPAWDKGYCPLCGSLPQGSVLKHTEGHRYLHCSLCGHQWQYARAACPVCEQQDSKNIPLFFLEDHPEERAEACTVCNQYLLGLDTRKMADNDPPLDLHFLCMGPLDILMQEKGFSPLFMANERPARKR